jgi:hypothetical protein
MKDQETELHFADPITREQARAFVARWFKDARSGDMFDAFASTGIMGWPDPDDDNTPAQGRYHEIESEILDRTCEAVKDLVADAFLVMARAVVARERGDAEGATEARPPVGRYDAYEPELRAILDLARAARRMERLFADVEASDFLEDLSGVASGWALSLVTIIIDYEEETEQRSKLAGGDRVSHPD